ncbi:hypothetical protein SECTIM467_174 [Brevibacillus phage SecTim467]|uniref:Uncharacterized protein n=1 Tax=Brevibacillus phage SecTim467 TaxID=1691956 RepID=A0A0K2CPN4_9CAUD|nr:hypothetical protein SECTIM467_174 [Brevibacillus phage SecTim467]
MEYCQYPDKLESTYVDIRHCMLTVPTGDQQ